MQLAIRGPVMGEALSDKQIMKLVEKKANLVTSDEIKNYSNVFELMGKHKACIILYITKVLPNNNIYGHWCCIFVAPWAPNTISFFDPYGAPPDASLEHMSPQAAKEFSNKPILSKMLDRAASEGWNIVYSNAPLQQHGKGIAICGRLTGLRLQFRELSNVAFNQMMNSYSKGGITSNDLAAIMTSFIGKT